MAKARTKKRAADNGESGDAPPVVVAAPEEYTPPEPDPEPIEVPPPVANLDAALADAESLIPPSDNVTPGVNNDPFAMPDPEPQRPRGRPRIWANEKERREAAAQRRREQAQQGGGASRARTDDAATRVRMNREELARENERMARELARVKAQGSAETIAALGDALGETFGFAAEMYALQAGAHWKLTDGEKATLGALWAKPLAPYMDGAAEYLPWLVAAAATYRVVSIRVAVDRGEMTPEEARSQTAVDIVRATQQEVQPEPVQEVS